MVDQPRRARWPALAAAGLMAFALLAAVPPAAAIPPPVAEELEFVYPAMPPVPGRPPPPMAIPPMRMPYKAPPMMDKASDWSNVPRDSWLTPCKTADEVPKPRTSRPMIGVIFLHKVEIPPFVDPEGRVHPMPPPHMVPQVLIFRPPDNPSLLRHEPKPQPGCNMPFNGNVPPWPSAQITIQDACEAIVRFDGFGSSDVDGLVTGYHWDFGDESFGDQPVVEHRYAGPGTYRVEFRITDDTGASSPAAGYVEIPPCNKGANGRSSSIAGEQPRMPEREQSGRPDFPFSDFPADFPPMPPPPYGPEYGPGYGSGSGYGSDYGSGYGSDYGSDYGSGYGSGYGSDYGSGYGAGGYGSGDYAMYGH